eukprot:scaffold11263_cov108-Isochrysis_galbana.AAC.5
MGVTLALPLHGVAAHYNVAAQHGVALEVVVDLEGDDGGGHRELDGRGVDHADDVARAGGAEGAEEGAVEAVLSVELNDLLVVVGSLEQLDAGVERPAIGGKHNLREEGTCTGVRAKTKRGPGGQGLWPGLIRRVDRRVEGVGAEGAALDGGGRVEALVGRLVDAVVEHVGREGELELPDVAERDGVGAAGGLDHAAEGAHLAVLDVDAHLDGCVVGTVPQLDIGIERAALGAQLHLHRLDGRVAVRPGAEGAALHEDGGVLELLGPGDVGQAARTRASRRRGAAALVALVVLLAVEVLRAHGSAVEILRADGDDLLHLARLDRDGGLLVAQLHHRRRPQDRRRRGEEEGRARDEEAEVHHGGCERGRGRPTKVVDGCTGSGRTFERAHPGGVEIKKRSRASWPFF